MLSFNARMQVVVDNANKVIQDLLDLSKKQVLVGVPEEKDPRTVKEPSKIGNAALAYIHENGSPVRGIPPRPFIDPGIKNAQENINAELLEVAMAQLDGDQEKSDLHLNRAGLIAASSIKRVLNEGEGFAPLKRSTKLARLRRRKAMRNKPDEEREAVMESMHPLVDTGQLRNSISFSIGSKDSISYVVADKK
jgi:hypothetical protein